MQGDFTIMNCRGKEFYLKYDRDQMTQGGGRPHNYTRIERGICPRRRKAEIRPDQPGSPLADPKEYEFKYRLA